MSSSGSDDSHAVTSSKARVPPLVRRRGRGKQGSKQPPSPSIHPWRSISDYAKAWSHSVSSVDANCIQFCIEKGIPHRVSVGKPSNPHAISHVCRDEAFRSILVREGVGKTRLKVLDWFGTGRNLKFMPCNGPKHMARDGPILGSSEEIFSIRFVFGPNPPIQGDSGRSMGNFRREVLPEEVFDIVLVQDVYHDGPSPISPFLPRTILSLLEHSSNNGVYVANRCFSGEMGCDKETGKEVEQVYYRDSEGLIVSSPDSTSAPYPAHPDTDWLYNFRSYMGVDITPLQQIGPFKLVRCASTYNAAQVVGVQHRIVAEVVTLNVLKPALNFVFGPVLPVHYVHPDVYKKLGWFWRLVTGAAPKSIVHVPTYNKLHNKYVLKQPNGQILDSALSSVERELGATPLYIHLSSRFPTAARNLLDGTLESVLYSEKSRVVGSFYNLRKDNAHSEKLLAETRAGSVPQAWANMLPRWFVSALTWSSFGGGALCAFLARYRIVRTLRRLVMSLIPLVRRIIKEFVKLSQTALHGAFLLPSRPLVSAIGEEIVHYFGPLVGGAMVMVEWLFRAFDNPKGATVTLLFHGLLSLLRKAGWKGKVLAVVFHLAWNMTITMRENRVEYEAFKLSYNLGLPVDPTNTWNPVPAGDFLSSYVSTVVTGLSPVRGVCKIFIDGEKKSAEEALEALSDEVGKNYTYPILVTQRLLHQPANVAKNLLVAVLSRTHQDPFEDMDPEEVRHARWRNLADVLISSGGILETDRMFTMVECYKMMGRKAPRIRNALEAFVDGQIVTKGKTINLKWNETLSIAKDVGNCETMKPRAIQNLPAEIHGLMSPFARYLDSVMHTYFDGRILVVGGIACRIIYASGSTGRQLSEIASFFATGEFVIVVSGDDSVVSFGYLQNTRNVTGYAEADQSAFDHTQDDGPMLHFQSAIQKFLGIPEEFTRLAYECCSSGYTARKGRLFVKGRAGTQMPTGITTTTSFNSFSTIAFWLYWALESGKDPLLTPALAGKQLGFKVKCFLHEHFTSLTFLKGWWMHTFESGFVWYPLPSALLKLGKVITDPVVITSYRCGGRRRYVSPRLAVQMCAFALASSYGNVPADYPVFGAFLSCLKRLGKIPGRALRRLEEGWKPICEASILDRQGALDQMFERYLITESEIVEVETLLGNVNVLPAFISHSVFDKLADLDYC